MMLRNKTVTKILSLLIAVALWGYVVWNTNPIIDTTLRGVPVQILNESTLKERGLTIISGPEGEYNVDIKVSGKKKDIGSLKAGDIFATADIGGYGAGETTIAVRVSTLDNISVISINPGKLTFTIDTIASQQKEVRASIGGSLPDGTELASLTASLESVTVSGGQTLVDKVAYVRAELAAEEISEGESRKTVQLVPVDSRGELVEKVTLSEESADVVDEEGGGFHGEEVAALTGFGPVHDVVVAFGPRPDRGVVAGHQHPGGHRRAPAVPARCAG